MYVIKIRRGDDPCRFFYGVEKNILIISSYLSHAMVFSTRADALIMSVFLVYYFYTLGFNFLIYPLSVDEANNFPDNFEQEYFEL